MSLEKWKAYYTSGSLAPWDSHYPSSQLVYFMSKCPRHLVDLSSSRDVLTFKEHVGFSGRFHSCPKCEGMRPVPAKSININCLELACGTGASSVYMAQLLCNHGQGCSSRVIGAVRNLCAMHVLLPSVSPMHSGV